MANRLWQLVLALAAQGLGAYMLAAHWDGFTLACGALLAATGGFTLWSSGATVASDFYQREIRAGKDPT